MLFTIDILFSLAFSACASIFGGIVTSAIDFWKPILIFIGTFCAFFLLALGLLCVFSLFLDKKPPKKPNGFIRALFILFDSFLITISNVRVKTSGFDKLDKKKAYFFVSNHRSKYDNMILASLLKKYPLLMISKPENLSIPVVGKIIRKAGYMSINRENDREALKTILLAAKRITEGYSVCACPEGTRNKEGMGLLPFKNGVFKVAYKAKAPIAVICLNGTENIKKYNPFRPKTVYVDLLEVIDYEAYRDFSTAETGNAVREKMLEKIKEHNGGDEEWTKNLSAA